MFRLDDFQLVLDGHFSEDWAHKERDEPLESIYVMTGRDIEPAKHKKDIWVFDLNRFLEMLVNSKQLKLQIKMWLKFLLSVFFQVKGNLNVICL